MVLIERTFKYLTFTIQIVSIFPFLFHFSCQLLQNQKRQHFIHFFSFALNVILKLLRIFESMK